MVTDVLVKIQNKVTEGINIVKQIKYIVKEKDSAMLVNVKPT